MLGQLTLGPQPEVHTIPKNLDVKMGFAVGSNWLHHYLGFLFPTMMFVGMYIGGWGNFIVPLTMFGVVPLLDMIVGEDSYNPKHKRGLTTYSQEPEDLLFRLPLYLWVLFQYFWIFYVAYYIIYYDIPYFSSDFIGLTISVGALNGASFVVSHDLGHRLVPLEKFFAKALLLTSGYMHFVIEHVYGHHKNVATLDDPATARLGESLYSFLPRSIVGGYLNAWQIEWNRLLMNHESFFGYHNRMIWYTALPVLFLRLIYVYLGGKATIYFILQAMLAFIIFESINYIEHYGLLRSEVSPGKYEPVNAFHSWNANTSITNSILLKIQRHSDHHVHSLKPYQNLLHIEDAPQLPFGYSTMLVIALIPPLWFHIMNPLAKKANQFARKRFMKTSM